MITKTVCDFQTKKELESCMDQWKEFDSWYERCSSWLKDIELKVKDTELKATLKDKQNQLDKLRKLQEELTARQGDIDALSDSAQDLVKISTDTRVISQSSQLATKYQTLRVNVKVSTVMAGNLLNQCSFLNISFHNFLGSAKPWFYDSH